ncbi:MAG: IS1 family transposase [Symbiopectobacterium sp.]
MAFWCTDGYHFGALMATGLTTTNFQKQNTLLANCIHSVLSVKISTLCNLLKRLNRKTFGYSKSSEMHDRLIGTYIEREYIEREYYV